MSDFEKIKAAAEGYGKDMNAFLRAIVKILEKAVMKKHISIRSPRK